jgi:prepilin-type N-terminal cleavage/methylation domain-containing protein/prepilin-type processing-associated H-X9-DG protein
MKKGHSSGFTLVELLVVIGIIAILISLLLPSLAKAREAASNVKCMSNMRQVGMQLQLYADQNGGYMWPEAPGWDWSKDQTINPPLTVVNSTYPTGDSQESRIPKLWPNAVWGRCNPPEMMCPNDEGNMPLNFDERIYHSYMVNGHLEKSPWDNSSRKLNRFGLQAGAFQGRSTADVILLGEKVVNECDYTLGQEEYAAGKVDVYKHGARRGANYLYLDLHVATELPGATRTDPNDPARKAKDPWDPLLP